MHKSQIFCSDASWKFVVKMQHVDISHLVCRFAMVLVSWANSSYFLINLLVCSSINFLHHQSHWATHSLVRQISQDHFLAMILWRNWNAGFPLPMQVFDEYVYFSCSFYPIEKKLGIHFQWCQIPSGVANHTKEGHFDMKRSKCDEDVIECTCFFDLDFHGHLCNS